MKRAILFAAGARKVVFPAIPSSVEIAQKGFTAKGVDVSAFTIQVKYKTTFLFLPTLANYTAVFHESRLLQHLTNSCVLLLCAPPMTTTTSACCASSTGSPFKWRMGRSSCTPPASSSKPWGYPSSSACCNC